MMERRRSLFRLSLGLNLLLLLFSFYIFSKDTALDKELTNFIYHGASRDSAPNDHPFHQHQNGLKQTFLASDIPCTICTAGPVGKRLCEEWGETVMNRLVAYEGTNHRLRRSLAKMRAGKPFTFASLGGSVSAGHGLNGESHPYSEQNMHTILFEYLNSTFPAAQGGILRESGKGKKNAFVNGAQPARGSDYFSMCAQLHIPEDVDFVVVELAINDPMAMTTVKTFELLLRSLLEYRNDPGVLMFNVFALKFDEIAMGGDLNHGNAQYYDIPTLSSRNALLPIGLRDKTKFLDWFVKDVKEPNKETLEGLDVRHFSPLMHRIAADMMIAYIELQLCEMDRLEAEAGKNWSVDDLYPLEPLPPLLLMEKYSPTKQVPKLQPFCMATNSEEYPLKPLQQSGWRPWSWKDKQYLIADKPGSTISFEFSSTQGIVKLYYLRAREFGLGNLRCEIEGQAYTQKNIAGYWDEPFNIGRTETWDGLPPGKHVLKCELLKETNDPKGGTEFRLISLMGI